MTNIAETELDLDTSSTLVVMASVTIGDALGSSVPDVLFQLELDLFNQTTGQTISGKVNTFYTPPETFRTYRFFQVFTSIGAGTAWAIRLRAAVPSGQSVYVSGVLLVPMAQDPDWSAIDQAITPVAIDANWKAIKSFAIPGNLLGKSFIFLAYIPFMAPSSSNVQFRFMSGGIVLKEFRNIRTPYGHDAVVLAALSDQAQSIAGNVVNLFARSEVSGSGSIQAGGLVSYLAIPPFTLILDTKTNTVTVPNVNVDTFVDRTPFFSLNSLSTSGVYSPGSGQVRIFWWGISDYETSVTASSQDVDVKYFVEKYSPNNLLFANDSGRVRNYADLLLTNQVGSNINAGNIGVDPNITLAFVTKSRTICTSPSQNVIYGRREVATLVLPNAWPAVGGVDQHNCTSSNTPSCPHVCRWWPSVSHVSVPGIQLCN